MSDQQPPKNLVDARGQPIKNPQAYLAALEKKHQLLQNRAKKQKAPPSTYQQAYPYPYQPQVQAELASINQWNAAFSAKNQHAPNPSDVIAAYKNEDPEVMRIMNQQPLGSSELYSLETAILNKDLNTISQLYYQKDISVLSNPEMLQVLRIGALDDKASRRAFLSKLGSKLKSGLTSAFNFLNPIAEQVIQQYVPGFSGPGPYISQSGDVSPHAVDAVDPKYVAGMLSPATFHVRVPKIEALKTSIFASSMDVELQVNTAGNGAIYILPRNPLAPGGNNLTDSFIAQYCDVTYDPSTGLQSVPPYYKAGPMVSNAAAVMTWILTSFTVEVIPHLSSTQDSGQMYATYWNRCLTPAMRTSSNFALSQPQMSVTPGFQIHAISDGPMRMTRIPNIDDQVPNTLARVSGPPTPEGFVISVSGVNATQPRFPVATVKISYVYEFQPEVDYLSFNPPEYSDNGADSVRSVALLLSSLPAVQTMLGEPATRLAQAFASRSTMRASDVMSIASSFVNSTPRPA